MRLVNWLCGHDYSAEQMIHIAPYTDFTTDSTAARQSKREAATRKAIKTLGKKYCLFKKKRGRK